MILFTQHLREVVSHKVCDFKHLGWGEALLLSSAEDLLVPSREDIVFAPSFLLPLINHPKRVSLEKMGNYFLRCSPKSCQFPGLFNILSNKEVLYD